jgi:TRAP transporter TAXI family solute receptor
VRGREAEVHISIPGVRVFLFFFLSLAITLSWGHCNEGRAQQPAKGGQKTALNLITTPAGTGTYTVAVGQGTLLNKKLPQFKVTVQPASGALALPRLLAKGEAQLVTIAAPTMYWAYRGEEDFTSPLPSLRLLQSGNDMYFALLTRSDTGIQTIEELRGKRVTYEIPSARLITKLGMLHLQAFGLDPRKDVTALKAEFTTMALSNLMDKRTDAIMASLGGSKMAEAEAKIGIKILPFPENKVPFLRQSLPVFYAAKTPSGLPGVSPGVAVVATPGILAANEDLSNETAYLVVKTLLENCKELFPIHKDFYGWAPERAVKDLGIPYHPGAIRYYKEKGLWTSEMEQREAQLLKTGK